MNALFLLYYSKLVNPKIIFFFLKKVDKKSRFVLDNEKWPDLKLFYSMKNFSNWVTKLRFRNTFFRKKTKFWAPIIMQEENSIRFVFYEEKLKKMKQDFFQTTLPKCFSFLFFLFLHNYSLDCNFQYQQKTLRVKYCE